MFVAGCQGPSKANIELRKQNAELAAQVAQLQRQHEADVASMKALQAGGQAKLAADSLDNLFTVAGISISKLTAVVEPTAETSETFQLRVVATPTDASGQSIKAAGSFRIELFDLARTTDTRIGQWEISTSDAMQKWIGTGLVNGYVLELPLDAKPQHSELTLKLTFIDELTARQFTAQKIIGKS